MSVPHQSNGPYSLVFVVVAIFQQCVMSFAFFRIMLSSQPIVGAKLAMLSWHGCCPQVVEVKRVPQMCILPSILHQKNVTVTMNMMPWWSFWPIKSFNQLVSDRFLFMTMDILSTWTANQVVANSKIMAGLLRFLMADWVSLGFVLFKMPTVISSCYKRPFWLVTIVVFLSFVIWMLNSQVIKMSVPSWRGMKERWGNPFLSLAPRMSVWNGSGFCLPVNAMWLKFDFAKVWALYYLAGLLGWHFLCQNLWNWHY